MWHSWNFFLSIHFPHQNTLFFINNLEWKAFFMWILCCLEVGWVIEIWGVTFLLVPPKDKFAKISKKLRYFVLYTSLNLLLTFNLFSPYYGCASCHHQQDMFYLICPMSIPSSILMQCNIILKGKKNRSNPQTKTKNSF